MYYSKQSWGTLHVQMQMCNKPNILFVSYTQRQVRSYQFLVVRGKIKTINPSPLPPLTCASYIIFSVFPLPALGRQQAHRCTTGSALCTRQPYLEKTSIAGLAAGKDVPKLGITQEILGNTACP